MYTKEMELVLLREFGVVVKLLAQCETETKRKKLISTKIRSVNL